MNQEARLRTLVAGVKRAKTFIEYARYELQPGKAVIGDQFPRQVDADEVLAELNALLSAPVVSPPSKFLERVRRVERVAEETAQRARDKDRVETASFYDGEASAYRQIREALEAAAPVVTQEGE